MTRRNRTAGVLLVALGTALAASAGAADAPKPGPIYELRTYTTAPGKLQVLVDRFREHNLPLFQRHGIKLVGAWTPAQPDEPGDRLVYLVSFPSREAASRAWAAFAEDPEWKKLYADEKEKHGTVVSKAENAFLAPTDYSPAPTDGLATGDGRIYELRTYVASPGKFQNLHARFRDHTLGLFRKHGMTNVLYTVPTDPEKGSDDTLVYFLAFPTREAADASWKAFRDDPEWQKVAAASQPDGIKLAAKVTSAFLKPTDFSPLR